MPPILPRVWPTDRLEQDRTSAIRSFVERRMKEGDPEYLRHFQESEALVERLLKASDDLTRLRPAAFLDEVELVEDVARFTTGPPVSADDFRTLLGLKKIHAHDATEVEKGLTLVSHLVDHRRFPWVGEKRRPTPSERHAAVVATASLRAVERARTGRRKAEQDRQEQFVAQTLRTMKLAEVRDVRHVDRDMGPGSFKRGVKFEGKQCDVLVRLYDERFLAIECKSSNSAVNSIKRLNDVFEKAQVWRHERGAKVVTAAVVAGVFDLASLETAQRKGIYLFWEHDLGPLQDYVRATKKTS